MNRRIQRLADRDFTERIFFEALILAHDIYGRYTPIMHPPQRAASLFEIEAARMLDLAICYSKEKKEFFYQRIN